MTKLKSIYRKPNGQYFIARNDDVTRKAYESMGFKITDRTGGVPLVMTPRIEVPRTDLRVMTDSEQMTQPSVARKVIDLAKNRNSWTGTATELVQELKEGKVNKLFDHGVLDYLHRSGIQVVKKRTMDKRLIQITRV